MIVLWFAAAVAFFGAVIYLGQGIEIYEAEAGLVEAF